MTIKEVKEKYAGEYADIEIYHIKSIAGRGELFHTDRIEFVDEDVPEDTEIGWDYELMDAERYTQTILCNTCDTADFAEWYDDKDAKVLVIGVEDGEQNGID